jgi:uncharacterized protein YjbJ (UPF0337 family)
MSNSNLTGNWKDIKEKLKHKINILTDDDLVFMDGKQDELLARLQLRLGKTKEEIRRLISEL